MKKPATRLEGVRHVKDIQRARSWCFYGRSGSGKTTLASTFPSPILLLDVRDRGTDSIVDQDVDVLDVDSLEQLEEAYYYLKERPDHYKAVVIDTVTQTQQLLTEVVTKKNGAAVGGWGSMSLRQMGDVAAKTKEWILNYRNLTDIGLEVIFLAQERTRNVPDDEEDRNLDGMLIPEVGPACMPSIAQFLNANVSVIGNTFVRNRTVKVKKGGGGDKLIEKQQVQYCVRVGPNPIYTTKLRKPRGITAPAFIEDPTYEDILGAMKGE